MGTLYILTHRKIEFIPIKSKKSFIFTLKTPYSGPPHPKDHDLFFVELLETPDRFGPRQAKKLEYLGSVKDPKFDTELVKKIHNIDFEFSEKVLAASEQCKNMQTTFARQDLTHLSFVTIDGEDARDFDDAIYLSPNNELYVAIADVAHYVEPRSPLDLEAISRANSYYFPDQVVPMLPEILSNNLCSLRENENKHVLVIKMKLNAQLQVSSADIFEAIIRSQKRLTYTEVQAYFNAGSSKTIPQTIQEDINRLRPVAKALRNARLENRSLDFRTHEPKVKIDFETGEILDFLKRQQNEAQQLIEECMLLANQEAAKFLIAHDREAVFRVHPAPDQPKVDEFTQLLKAYHVNLKPNDDPFLFLKEALSLINAKPKLSVFRSWALRTMGQAFYSLENTGHFGLGFENYVHFTSPIRRYSDLLVHRQIKNVLHKTQKQIFPEIFQTLHNVCVHISNRERVAQKAEWDILQRKGSRFLSRQKEGVFEAMVNGMTHKGLFLELKSFPIEGFLNMDAFRRDQYYFDEQNMMMVSRRRNKRIGLGDTFQVKIQTIDFKTGKVDFSYANDQI